MTQQQIAGIPFELVAQMISSYIYEKKGARIPVKVPQEHEEKEIELFLKAANIAMAYYGY